MKWKTDKRVYDLILELAKIPSISETEQELEMAETIAGALLNIPYFHKHPEQVETHTVKGDLLKRQVVTALLKGTTNSQKTVVLLSHYDVVGVEGFGQFQSDAFNPERLTERLRENINDSLEEDVQKDLESGDWLFGRGVMDMKAGLAMQMDVLEYFSKLDEFDGNILLIATPDEEVNSVGMFEAVSVLNQFKQSYDLSYEVCICSEANWAAYPEDDNRYIYTGSIGKLLPMIGAVGVEAHVGESLSGVNAGWMISEIANRMELSVELVDEVDGEVTPPPTCLDMRVVKESYNVQTPNFAYAMFNVYTFQNTPEKVLGIVRNLAHQASSAIHQRLQDRYKDVKTREGDPVFPGKSLSKVFSYSELYQLGVDRYGDIFQLGIEKIIKTGERESLGARQVSVQLAQYMGDYFIEEAPFYILMFGPPYIPHVYLDEKQEGDKFLQEVASRVRDDALSAGENVLLKKFFNGGSDVSYCHIHDAEQVLETLQSDMPVLNRLYDFPVNEISKLNLPTLNIGPYGKDAHKWTERLEIPFSTQIAPQLLSNAIQYVLQKENVSES